MDIVRIVIKGESGYCPVDEAFTDKVTITETSIKYEYKPHPCSNQETNVPRKWSYTTDSPLFKQVFKKVAEMTPKYLYSEDILYATDIGATEIIATFEDKHRESVNFFCPSEYFLEYFRMIKEMVPKTEYIPAVLLTSEDYEDEDDE
ncbi:MAG: hypothetical protein E7222_10650 [Clostridiales bacterium]|nr:hypothetical protein [Clostridiales bacterium]